MADRHGFPAPGSPVPGAPPPLKRTLAAADGVAVTPVVVGHGPNPTGSGPVVAPVTSRARFTMAAALVGVAVGLELARLWTSGGAAHIGPKY
ncbi:hypothetical protein A5740_06985 [Mycobacterium sp. GA-1841]|uniref:hypothetical protein n=1 Tax=Mycobacterium sp. GA-1841 TaxID=1834154 RepID=UPI00096D7A30|nr:hypothetical protein [Mycobacterium sp. GA-1841]OMC35932.1 hypothetical protein A5740_06985 [Mycobacterium sp. GA-1841]